MISYVHTSDNALQASYYRKGVEDYLSGELEKQFRFSGMCVAVQAVGEGYLT